MGVLPSWLGVLPGLPTVLPCPSCSLAMCMRRWRSRCCWVLHVTKPAAAHIVWKLRCSACRPSARSLYLWSSARRWFTSTCQRWGASCGSGLHDGRQREGLRVVDTEGCSLQQSRGPRLHLQAPPHSPADPPAVSCPPLSCPAPQIIKLINNMPPQAICTSIGLCDAAGALLHHGCCPFSGRKCRELLSQPSHQRFCFTCRPRLPCSSHACLAHPLLVQAWARTAACSPRAPSTAAC